MITTIVLGAMVYYEDREYVITTIDSRHDAHGRSLTLHCLDSLLALENREEAEKRKKHINDSLDVLTMAKGMAAKMIKESGDDNALLG